MSQNFIHFLIIALLLLNTILLLNCSHIMGGSSEGFAPKGKPKHSSPEMRCWGWKSWKDTNPTFGKGQYYGEGCDKILGPY